MYEKKRGKEDGGGVEIIGSGDGLLLSDFRRTARISAMRIPQLGLANAIRLVGHCKFSRSQLP